MSCVVASSGTPSKNRSVPIVEVTVSGVVMDAGIGVVIFMARGACRDEAAVPVAGEFAGAGADWPPHAATSNVCVTTSPKRVRASIGDHLISARHSTPTTRRLSSIGTRAIASPEMEYRRQRQRRYE